MRKLWPFTSNFLLFAAIAFVAPFIVLYYQELGFTDTQIGLLTSIVPLITLFSAPLWTGLADATHRHRLLMSLSILGGVITIMGAPNSPIADGVPPAERRNLTYAGTCMERGKPIGLPADASARESEPQGEPMDLRVEDGGRSECLPAMGRIGVELG